MGFVPFGQSELQKLMLFFNVFVESSKELEELRSAFARALDYMKQDVEERE